MQSAVPGRLLLDSSLLDCRLSLIEHANIARVGDGPLPSSAINSQARHIELQG